jgi:pimeloyl-ACP methyl ester carboxylesterase
VALRALAGGMVIGDVTGSGRLAAVLLHGWGRDRGDLRGVERAILELVGDATVASLDLPGFGSSPAPEESWGAREYAELVGTALRELAGSGEDGDVRAAAPVVIGHSFGGRVAVCLAARHPELVGGLVLSGVPLLRPAEAQRRKPPLTFRLARRLHRYRLVGEATMERYRQRYGSADYAAASGVMRSILVRVVAEDYRDELAALTCPVALVWGGADTAAPAELAGAAADLLSVPHTLDVVEGAGHDLHRADPQLFAQRAAELLDRSRR